MGTAGGGPPVTTLATATRHDLVERTKYDRSPARGFLRCPELSVIGTVPPKNSTRGFALGP
jgi:hypothetical protein